MKKLLFIISVTCFILCLIFGLSRVSLNGYKADIYFWQFTILICFVSFLSFLLTRNNNSFKVVTGLLFLCLTIAFINYYKGQKVKRIYTCWIAKQNMYASLTGTIYKQYFLPDNKIPDSGTSWSTKVPRYFPLIEIEYSRNTTFHIPTDSVCFEMQNE
jgi:hypothetical protein